MKISGQLCHGWRSVAPQNWLSFVYLYTFIYHKLCYLSFICCYQCSHSQLNFSLFLCFSWFFLLSWIDCLSVICTEIAPGGKINLTWNFNIIYRVQFCPYLPCSYLVVVVKMVVSLLLIIIWQRFGFKRVRLGRYFEVLFHKVWQYTEYTWMVESAGRRSAGSEWQIKAVLNIVLHLYLAYTW